MRERRFSTRQLIWTILLTAALTLGGVLLSLCLLLGPQGLSVMEGYLLIRTLFVDKEALNMDEVADAALYAMDEATGDRWTYYLGKDWNQNQLDAEANRGRGIGVTVLRREEGFLITDVVPQGGADQAGLSAGDLLTHVERQPLFGESAQENLERIRGEDGTHVRLTVLRRNGEKQELQVLRGAFFDDPVRYAMLEGGVGYVRVKDFQSGSADSAIRAVEALRAEGARSLLFDMRQNGGGFLTELTELLDYLLPEGVIFRQTGVLGWSRETRSDADCVDLPMAVLVDQDTYSAAELFAAQLRETAGTPIIGEKTSGKGYFQYHFAMPNGGGLGLSIGRYTTGSGVSLAGVGLKPDSMLSLTEEERAGFRSFALSPEEDPQLRTALRVLNGE